jgi:hypothetical protein
MNLIKKAGQFESFYTTETGATEPNLEVAAIYIKTAG